MNYTEAVKQAKVKAHEAANIFSMFSEEELLDLAEDIKTNGQDLAIVEHEGKILDGRNRYAACLISGVKPRFRQWAGTGFVVRFVVSANLLRRHLNGGQRAMASAELMPMFEAEAKKRQATSTGGHDPQLRANLPERDKGRARDHAARAVGSSPRSTESASKVLKDGCEEIIEAVKAGKVAVSVAALVVKLPKEKQVEALNEVSSGKVDKLISASAIHALQSSESNEWYTPKEFIEAARELMGSIDLDPASCEEANKVVRAGKFYAEKDNGLSKLWSGNVWLNPPYGRDENHKSNQGLWVHCISDHHRKGSITAGVLLVNAVTDRSWFKPLWDQPICFVGERIKFYSPTVATSGPTHGSVLVYYGDDEERFVKIFSKFGQCVLPGDGFCVTA